MEMQSALSSIFGVADPGDFSAADALYHALYSESHRIAKAYIEMVERERISFPDGAAFMWYAAGVMRGLIIDHARRRHARKRGDQFKLTSAETDPKDVPIDRDLCCISDALDELAKTESPLQSWLT